MATKKTLNTKVSNPLMKTYKYKEICLCFCLGQTTTADLSSMERSCLMTGGSSKSGHVTVIRLDALVCPALVVTIERPKYCLVPEQKKIKPNLCSICHLRQLIGNQFQATTQEEKLVTIWC